MFHMDPKQVEIKSFSGNQAGWAGLSLDGKTVFSREIREAFADVTQKLEKAIEDLQKAREAAAAAAAAVPTAPADGAQPSTASAGTTSNTMPSATGS